MPLTGATMLNLFMPRTKHFKQPVVDKLYSLNIILQGSAQDFLRGGRARVEPACPFRCLQTVVVLTVCMDKLDCHVIK